ncbi:MAG: MutS-related protein [Rectinemataceae bacterium]
MPEPGRRPGVEPAGRRDAEGRAARAAERAAGTAMCAATRETWGFARVEEFWSRYSPLTPYGKEAKEERRIFADRSRIEELYDATEAALAFLDRGEGPSLDRLSYHLRRLPRLPFGSLAADRRESNGLDLVELFQIKKFLSNYRAVLALVDESTKRAFGLDFESAELAARLDLGGSDPETFFIADAYHASLPEIRGRIAAVDESIGLERGRSLDAARRDHGLDFAGRDFLLVRNEEALALVEACAEPAAENAAGSGSAGPLAFMVEAYDGRSCVVRLRDGERVLLLEQERSLLASREREAEEEVLASISAAAAAESRHLRAYVDAICAFDLALAGARLAREYGLVRPDLGSLSLGVAAGRFLPCLWDCEELGLRYTPLGLDLAERAAVIFGSNMGGKTVALQSLLFFQILAQAGLFVPASSFACSVHSRIVYVGGTAGRHRDEDRHREDRGLSGFGFEMRSFMEAVGPSGIGAPDAFIVFDEFARTTGSREAEAILSAAIEFLARAGRGRFVFSTHFHGIRRAAGARFLRMRGLDREAADKIIGADEPLADRIRKINGMMRYEIVEARDEGAGGSDAIAIASLLGLEEGIVERAKSIYAAGKESNPPPMGE